MIDFMAPAGAKVLELGGGEHPTPVTTVNMDVRAIPTVQLVHDLESLPWPIPDAEFDAVVAQYVLEHVSWRQVPAVLKEIHRVLKPNGKLALVLPNTEAQMRWVQDHQEGWDGKNLFESASEVIFGGQDYSHNAHRSWWSPNCAMQILIANGFKDVSTVASGARDTDMCIEATRVDDQPIPVPVQVAEQPVVEQPLALPHFDLAPLDTAEDRVSAFSKEYFNGGAKWGGYAFGGLADFPVHEITARYVLARKPESVLEFGAARGYLGKRWEDKGIRYKGLEISKHCVLTRVSAGVVQHDICEGPWPAQDKEFDLAFSAAVLEHIPEKFLPNVIREMSRTCKRGLMGVDFGGKDDGFDRTHVTLRDRDFWYAKFNEHAPGWPVEIVDKEVLEAVPSSGWPKDMVEGDGKVKLNIGSFTSMTPFGWTNLDMHDLGQWATAHGYKYQPCDVRTGLPYLTGTVDLVFLHHSLDHLSYTEGVSLLRDIRRVLKPGGAVRIVVPDAAFYTAMYQDGAGLSEFDDMNEGCAQAQTSAAKLHALLWAGKASVYDCVTLVNMLQDAGFRAQVSWFRRHGTDDLTHDKIHPGTKQILSETIEHDYGGSSLVVDAWPEIAGPSLPTASKAIAINGNSNQICCWATDEPSNGPLGAYRKEFESKGVGHWSRVFEYPWVMQQGEFGPGMTVLDAGGGGDGGLLQKAIVAQGGRVVSVDLDGPETPELEGQSILKTRGDICNLNGIADDTFDRVVCVSVLEHIQWPNPIKAVNEMIRVLKPGGKLILTLDVASSSRWNHSFDLEKAEELLDTCFGVKIPAKPSNTLGMAFDELEPIAPGEARQVHLNVLCFICDKK